MRTVHYERKFRKDYKRQQKRGKTLAKLNDVITRLVSYRQTCIRIN